MRRTLTAFLVLLPVLALVGSALAWDEIWEPGVALVETYDNKDAIQGQYMQLRNKGGTTLSDGQVVLWNAGNATVATLAGGQTNIAAASITVSNTLSAEGGWHEFVIAGEARPNPGVFTITGTDKDGNSYSETITFTTGTTDVNVSKKTDGRWNTITAIAGDGAIDGTFTFVAYCPNGISGNVGDDDGSSKIAGVVVSDSAGNTGTGCVADNEECIVQYSGVAIAAVTDTAVLPGDLLATDADDEGLDETSNADYRCFGVALEPAVTAGEKIRIRINR